MTSHFNSPFPMKRLFTLLGAWCALITAALAQNAAAPGQAKKTDPVDPQVAVVELERTTLNNAVTLATTTDLSKGVGLVTLENSLTALNQSKPNSAESRLETAQRLLQVAEQAARAGKPANVALLAQRALQQLQVADTPAQDAPTRAAAKTLAAWIYERYLGDSDSALASYQAAAQLDPANAKANEAATRVKGAKDNVKLKPVHNS